jgi:hypothetical protein
MHTVESIRALLRNNDRAVARALVALTARQTTDEQRDETTKYRNDVGFMPCDARRGTSMARFYQRYGYLTPKQVAYWRCARKNGKQRIESYAAQLLEIAQQRAVSVDS